MPNVWIHAREDLFGFYAKHSLEGARKTLQGFQANNHAFRKVRFSLSRFILSRFWYFLLAEIWTYQDFLASFWPGQPWPGQISSEAHWCRLWLTSCFVSSANSFALYLETYCSSRNKKAVAGFRHGIIPHCFLYHYISVVSLVYNMGSIPLGVQFWLHRCSLHSNHDESKNEPLQPHTS